MILLLTALLVLPAGCATVAPPVDAPQMVVVDRLFFGTNIPGGGKVSDEDWKAFVNESVTPRFKDGLTIFEANGQWLDPRGELVKQHVMVIEIAHPPGARVDADLRAIADEYKKRFHHDAVLRVTIPASMAFY